MNGKLPKLKFKPDEVINVAEKLRGRWRYEEGYRNGDLNPWECAFAVSSEDEMIRSFFSKLDLNEKNPFIWRALLEEFVKTYAMPPGRPRKRSVEAFFALALDVIQVKQEHLKGEWVTSDVASELQKCQPYRDKYQKMNFDNLRKEVKNVQDRIGPIDDDDAMLRLKKLDPERFFKAFDLWSSSETEEKIRRSD